MAPLDRRAGGTWLGVSRGGLFAAVTNRRTEAADPARASRGGLVMAALGERSARRAADRVAALDPGTHNPFNFFVADRDSAHLVSYDEGPERFDLEPGPHVIGNVHPEEPSPKLERLRKRTHELCASRGPSLDALGELCREHADTPLASTCVHAGEYGTRSSTLLRIGDAPSLRHADGPPCERPYRDLTPLLGSLGIVRVPEGARAQGATR